MEYIDVYCTHSPHTHTMYIFCPHTPSYNNIGCLIQCSMYVRVYVCICVSVQIVNGSVFFSFSSYVWKNLSYTKNFPSTLKWIPTHSLFPSRILSFTLIFPCSLCHHIDTYKLMRRSTHRVRHLKPYLVICYAQHQSNCLVKYFVI